MTFLSNLISLLRSFLSLSFLQFWFFPLIALAFLATVPVIFRKFFL